MKIYKKVKIDSREWSSIVYEDDGDVCKLYLNGGGKYHEPAHHWDNWFKIYDQRYNNHPNFVKVIDYEAPDYIKMEKVNYVCSLYERICHLLLEKALSKNHWVDEQWKESNKKFKLNQKESIIKIFNQYRDISSYILSFNDTFLHNDLFEYKNVVVDENDNLTVLDPDSFRVCYVSKKEQHYSKYKMYKTLAQLCRVKLFIINANINISWNKIRYGHLRNFKDNYGLDRKKISRYCKSKYSVKV